MQTFKELKSRFINFFLYVSCNYLFKVTFGVDHSNTSEKIDSKTIPYPDRYRQFVGGEGEGNFSYILVHRHKP